MATSMCGEYAIPSHVNVRDVKIWHDHLPLGSPLIATKNCKFVLQLMF